MTCRCGGGSVRGPLAVRGVADDDRGGGRGAGAADCGGGDGRVGWRKMDRRGEEGALASWRGRRCCWRGWRAVGGGRPAGAERRLSWPPRCIDCGPAQPTYAARWCRVRLDVGADGRGTGAESAARDDAVHDGAAPRPVSAPSHPRQQRQDLPFDQVVELINRRAGAFW